MVGRETRKPPVPEAVGSTDVGFVAAAGVYTAAVLVGLTVTVAFGTGAGGASVLGSVTTVATAGLVLGAALVGRSDGLPERLGRQRRRRAVAFLAPVAFAAVVVAALEVQPIPRSAAVGAGFGAVATFLAALVVAKMARTRYARAAAPDEPRVTFPWMTATRDRYWIGVGLACYALSALLAFGMGDVGFGIAAWTFAFLGTFAVYVALSYRLATADGNRESAWTSITSRWLLSGPVRPFISAKGNAWLPVQPEHKKTEGGKAWDLRDYAAEEMPELRVHETGLVMKHFLDRRFLPWTAVDGVHLTDDALVVERRGWFDIRCARLVIDDPETVVAEIERARTDGETRGAELE